MEIRRFVGRVGSSGTSGSVSARPETEAMREMVAALRERFGTAEQYLTQQGVEPAALERLRSLMLE